MSPEDPRQPILGLLTQYLDRYPAEAEMIHRYSQFVADHDDCFERALEVGHVTGSAFLLDTKARSVLLTHHKKLERWLQPGGHADGDYDVARVAMTEALEESGLKDITFVMDELLDVDIHQIPARKKEPQHYHFDCRFLLQAVNDDQYVVSEESNDLAWVPLVQLMDFTDEQSILRMRTKTLNLLQ